jgi:glycosyltransferase involved in cell wall biosynthesis
MVLLIGNYSLDQQHSMQRFGDLMLRGLTAAGVKASLIAPWPVFGKLFGARGWGKWLAYVDKYLLFRFQLRRHMGRHPSVIHICDHSNAVYVKRGGKAPVVVTCHDLLAVRGGLGEETDCPPSLTGRFLQRWILRGLRKANAVACVSRATATDAHRLVSRGEPDPVIEVIPLALNFDYHPISSSEAQSILKSRAGVNSDLPFVLHVGSNLRRKNRDAVIRIFARTKEKWNGRLVFAGERLNDELTGLARQLGVSDRVIEIENPPGELLRALYNRATALLFPSRFEGFGWPIMEAQACGCPVLCSDTGPLPEAAGEAALLRDVADEAGFAADLISLTSPESRAAWSARSLRSAERFSPEKMISQYVTLYGRVGARL